MGVDKTREIEFENNIVDAMVARGWVHDPSNAGWDPKLALHVPDVMDWLQTQYPDEYEKIIPESVNGGTREAAERKLAIRLSKVLDLKPIVNADTGRETNGLLGVLRVGFRYAEAGRPAANFGPLAGFPPANPTPITDPMTVEANRFRVMRQVRFNPKTGQSIDLVLLVNGVPVATIELKTDNTQSLQAGIVQYMKDRKPTVDTPLLRPGRCLVHFAVSNQNVQMTTVLAGKATRFIPFDKGNDGHAGNPPSETGSATDYLWREVLAPATLLRILQSYALREKNGVLIFPRYHQLRAVEAVREDVLAKGAGEKYLIWHSAGSGKTKTIAWLAHRLGRLYHDNGDKAFDSVIVISDRTVLDDQLRDAVQLLGAAKGYVVGVGEKKGEAKSPQLRQALREGGRIITCTLQSFPEVLKLIEGDENLAGRKWCVVADEAHSSQTGKAASGLRRLLSEEYTGDEDGDEELSTDDLLLMRDEAIAEAANITFIACTATPKHRTLRMFGTQTPEGRWEAFDTYTMAQAIEEKFILDVLQRYTTYAMFAHVRDNLGRVEEVDEQAALSEFTRFVRLHPTSIAQKVEIVVEHFRKNVAGSLDGTAKAMVVTDSRIAAVRWANEVNKYLAKHGYTDMEALVAFSGTVTDNGTDYTERGMNEVPDVARHFAEHDEAKVLIAADKFQTGFDEPRLCVMYVDKKLGGIQAVQTLSRLNRAFPNKPVPIVLDFRNEPSVIQAAFADYYSDAYIDEEIDPNALLDLGDVLDAAGLYSEEEMVQISDAYLAKEGTGEDLHRELGPIINRWQTALASGDKTRRDELWEFKANARKYANAWDFFSQITTFGDPTFHRRAILARLLDKNLRIADRPIETIDTSGVELAGVAVVPTGEDRDFGLSEGTDEGLATPGLAPAGGGPGERGRKEYQAIIAEVNDAFSAAGISITEGGTEAWMYAVWVNVMDDPRAAKLLAENTPEQLASSPTYRDILTLAALKHAQESETVSETMGHDLGLVNKMAQPFAKFHKFHQERGDGVEER